VADSIPQYKPKVSKIPELLLATRADERQSKNFSMPIAVGIGNGYGSTARSAIDVIDHFVDAEAPSAVPATTAQYATSSTSSG